MIAAPNCIFFAAGGTGGHLFPAQTLARLLHKRDPSVEVLFIGAHLHTSRFFHQEGFAYREIIASPITRRGILRALQKLLQGSMQAYRLMRKHRPLFVVGFGSFHAFPTLLSALLCRVPIVLFEPNQMPGKVNRLFSRFALFSAVQFPSTPLKSPLISVQMPARSFCHEHIYTREEAFSYFSLQEGKKTVLIFGGSQGAEKINQYSCDMLSSVPEYRDVQVIHLVGEEQRCEAVSARYKVAGIESHVKSFEPNMHLAWMIADVTICRAGANTIAEIIHFAVPALLIPYAKATDAHQLYNARFLEQEGGGICLEEKDITEIRLSHDMTLLWQQKEMMKKVLCALRDRTHVRLLDDVIWQLVQCCRGAI